MNYYVIRLLMVLVTIIMIVIIIKVKKFRLNKVFYVRLIKYILILYVVLLLIPFDSYFYKLEDKNSFIKYRLPYYDIYAVGINNNYLYSIYNSDSDDYYNVAVFNNKNNKISTENLMLISRYITMPDYKVTFGTIDETDKTIIVIYSKLSEINYFDSKGTVFDKFETNDMKFYVTIIDNIDENYFINIMGKEIYFK